ncbi:hypothetical protein [Paraburkholderia strydomiana]|uniref:hypothetical protein n=1 Tax=Paraburkholderia strydomiana TaxID=1245417 RepID=UPI0038BC20EC
MNEFVFPNYYVLNGEGVSVSYYSAHVFGPWLTLTGAQLLGFSHQSTFHGDEIRVTDNGDLGRLVSVTTFRTIDSGSVSLSILIPPVNLFKGPPISRESISTYGINAHHRFTVIQEFMEGQLTTYDSIQLVGTASSVSPSAPVAVDAGNN